MNFQISKLSRERFVPSCRRGWQLACLVALLASFNDSLFAQEIPATYPPDQIDNYLLAIEAAETQGGPYATKLIDLYYGFGQALLDQGEIEEALDAFQQTAIITRVNHGPHSLEQSNYLYSVARVESLLGNLEPAIDVIEYIYQIHAREYGESNPEMLTVLDEIDRWYNEVKPLQSLHNRSSDYQNASFLASRKAVLTAARYGMGSPQAAEGFRTQGQLHFRAILYMFRTGEPPIPNLVINGGESNNPWVVERSISNHFRAGREAFENALQSRLENPESTTLDVAEATAQLGDWYLVLEKFRAAGKQYQQAYQILAGGGEYQQLADRYFGEPTPLRFLRVDGPFTRDLDPPTADQVLEIIMDVSRNGRISDIEFRNIPGGESQEDIDKVRRRLERTRFRPAVVSGEVSETERFVWVPPPTGAKMASRSDQGPLTP